MPISYSIDRENRIIEEKWTGKIDKDVLADYWKRYLDDPAVLEIRRTLVDMRGSFIHFNGEQLRSLIDVIVIPVLKGRSWITAIVVDAPYQYGVGRQYQVFSELYSKDSIFYSIDEARRWLLNQNDQ